MASVQMQELTKVMKQMMEQSGMPMFGEEINPVVLRATIEAAQANMPQISGVSYAAETLGGVEAEVCTPQNARNDAILFYIHGGGLICGNAYTSRGYASMLAAETKMPVYTLSYRLAPEHPFPAAVNDSFAAYKDLAERFPKLPIFLIGESGGGYLSIVTALKARDNGIKLPAGVIPYSPVIDLSLAVDRSANDGKDITVTSKGLKSLQKMYVTDENLLKDAYVSPYYADFTGLPPMFLAWDADETLAQDSEIVVEKLKAANVYVEYKAYPECFHAFATTGNGTPESAEILKNTKEFILKHI